MMVQQNRNAIVPTLFLYNPPPHFLFGLLVVIFSSQMVGGRCPRGVMVKTMDCGIVESEFVLQSRYYVHFRTYTLGKGMNPLILPAMG